MSDRTKLILGVVKDGVVVPDPAAHLPEGATVEMVILPANEFTPEERAEFEGWEKIGDEAWAMIDWWEQEEPLAHDSG